jgi:hypothetical protein
MIYLKTKGIVDVVRQKHNYLNYMSFKSIKGKGRDQQFHDRDEELSQKNLFRRKYIDYYNNLKRLDNKENMGIQFFETKVDKQNNFLNIRNKYNKVKKKSNINLRNIFNWHINDIKGRKISNRLINPHYFFTDRYVEKSMPSQLKSWTSSIYNFVKNDRIVNHYLDIFTSKFIKLFFNIKYLKRKNVWNIQLNDGFKIMVDLNLINDINTVIGYTAKRTSLAVRKLVSFPRVFLGFEWVKEQIKRSVYFNKILEMKKSDIFGGYMPKTQIYFRRLRRILLSKPLFKHTSYNLVIDLFLFNNKGYKFRMVKNLLLRRSTYKYMYSMYSDCYNKIQETINRPRFFYINIINPGTFNYYKRIVNYYRALIVRKPFGLYLLLWLLQLKFISNLNMESIKKVYLDNNLSFIKNFNLDWNSSNRDKSSVIVLKKGLYNNKTKRYSKLINKKRHISYLPLKVNIKQTSVLYNVDKKVVHPTFDDINLDSKKKVKKLSRNKKSQYIIYKKYFADLERRSHEPVDLNSLTLWSKDNLGKIYKTPLGNINEYDILDKKKKGGKNKFSYKNSKRKNDFSIDKLFLKKNENPKFYFNKIKKWNKFKDESLNYGNIQEHIHNDSSYQFNDKDSQFNENKIVNTTNQNELSINKKESIVEPVNIYLNKVEFINKIYDNYKENEDMSYILLTSFYQKKENKYSNNYESKKDKRMFSDFKPKFNINNRYINGERNSNRELINKINHEIYSILRSKSLASIKEKPINYKGLWNGNDNTIIGLLSNYVGSVKGIGLEYQNLDFKFLFNKINKFRKFGNIWYLMYFFNIIQKEFNSVSKDVLIPNIHEVIPYSHKENKNIFFPNIMSSINLDTGIGIITLNPISAFYLNDRENELNLNMGYNEKLFKPYYRYMIPYLFVKYYNIFISNLGSFPLLNVIFSERSIKRNNFDYSSIMIYKYISVKILLDLLHYNYRSLIRLKTKFYYLNKLRLYETKFKRMNINSWRTGVKYIKKLRKTRKKHWVRLHKLTSFFFDLIIKNAELDTNRKIFVPFVIYLEDILYTIYGKWAIIRLWPLKKFLLSSYILAHRVLLLIIWRRKAKRHQYHFLTMTTRLISGIRALQLKRAYEEYLENISKWPQKLIFIMKDGKDAGHLNYNSLEFFFEKKKKKLKHSFTLNTYILTKQNLSLIWSPLDRYFDAFNKNKDVVKRWKRKKINSNMINKVQFVYYWLRPLKHYIRKLTRNTDISGIKFRIAGRPGIRRNNLRSLYKNRFFGNFLGPYFKTREMLKRKSISTPRLRGYVKSNIDYALSIAKTKNGSISFKVWISSLISSDVHELLLYLIQVKDLYTQIIDRYYNVNSKLTNLDLIKSTDKMKYVKKTNYSNKRLLSYRVWKRAWRRKKVNRIT